MRNAERGTRNGPSCRRDREPAWQIELSSAVPRSAFPVPRFVGSAFRVPRSAFFAGLILLSEPGLAGAQALPPLPDQTGFGVHVLALARAPDDAIWVGSYGDGIFVLRPGAGTWEHLKHSTDSAARSISWDFVHAFAFGPSGE